MYISGSARNDGVHSLVSGAMEDADGEETFDGTLWFLYPPRPFIEIAKECAEYETKTRRGLIRLNRSGITAIRGRLAAMAL